MYIERFFVIEKYQRDEVSDFQIGILLKFFKASYDLLFVTVRAIEVAFINLLEPIIAVFGGIILFNERLDILGVIGAVLVLFSIVLVSLRK